MHNLRDGSSVWEDVSVFSDTHPPRRQSISVVDGDDVIQTNLVLNNVSNPTRTSGPEIEVMDEETDDEEDEIYVEPKVVEKNVEKNVEKTNLSPKMKGMVGRGYYVNGKMVGWKDSTKTTNVWYRTLVQLKKGAIVVQLYSIVTKKMKKKTLKGSFTVHSERQFWAELETFKESKDVYMTKKDMPRSLQEHIWGSSNKRGRGSDDSGSSSGSSSKKTKTSCVHDWQPISFPDGIKIVVCKHCALQIVC